MLGAEEMMEVEGREVCGLFAVLVDVIERVTQSSLTMLEFRELRSQGGWWRCVR